MAFGKLKVRLDAGLYAKAVVRAEALGYGDVDEFVCHLLEGELEKPLDGAADPESAAAAPASASKAALEKLKGLGYFAW